MSRSAVLLVEDDPQDLFLFRRAFQNVGCSKPMRCVANGEEAIAYLQGRGGYSDRAHYPMPCIILTDLKMPRMDGFELMTWVRTQPHLKQLPIITISGSGHEADIRRSRELGALKHYVKPSSYDALENLAREITHEWIDPHCPEPVLSGPQQH